MNRSRFVGVAALLAVLVVSALDLGHAQESPVDHAKRVY
jgi:hypothetical protein